MERAVRNCLGALRHQDSAKLLQEMTTSLMALMARVDQAHWNELVLCGALTGQSSILILECHPVGADASNFQVEFAAVGLWQLESGAGHEGEALCREFLGVRGTQGCSVASVSTWCPVAELQCAVGTVASLHAAILAARKAVFRAVQLLAEFPSRAGVDGDVFDRLEGVALPFTSLPASQSGHSPPNSAEPKTTESQTGTR